MDLCKFKILIDFVLELNIFEFEIIEVDGKVCIVKFDGSVVGLFVGMQMMVVLVLVVFVLVVVVVFVVVVVLVVVVLVFVVLIGYIVILLMVGIFYWVFSLNVKFFVDIGGQIKEGELICIIEVMKIMNEIDLDKIGMIIKILCENGQLVEFGQLLFVVE